MDLNTMSTEELAELLDAAQRVLAGRQTQDAIVRDVTAAVDPIIVENRDLLGGSWQAGRVSWDGHCMTIEQPPEEATPVASVAAEVAPEPVEWDAGATYSTGTRLTHDGHTYEVAQSHLASGDRPPGSSPALYKEV